MIYTKTDASGRQIFSDCRVLEVAPKEWVSNPTPEMIAADGWVEFIPPVVPPQPLDEPDIAEMISAVKRMLASSVADLTDEEALAVASLYPTWHSMLGKEVTTGERLWDDGKLWKVLQPHTVQENWRPADSPSLYVEVSIAEIPDWEQPAGSTDAYKTGDKVKHNSLVWESLIDGNVWEPGAVGSENLWKEV